MSAHAIDRAKERYGIDLTREDIEAMAMMVALGDPRVVRISNRFPQHSEPGKLVAIRYGNQCIPARWIMAVVVGGRIITFYRRADIHASNNRRLAERKAKLISLGLEPGRRQNTEVSNA